MNFKGLASIALLVWSVFQVRGGQSTVTVLLLGNVTRESLNTVLIGSEAVLTNIRNPKLEFRTKGNLMFRNVPYGTYDLRVLPGVGSGFAPTRREIVVNDENALVVIGLDVAAIDNSPWRDVVGKVKGQTNKFTWVKLVGLLTNTVREASLDGEGTFRFKNVEYGSYIFMAVRDGHVCDVRSMEILPSSSADFALECR